MKGNKIFATSDWHDDHKKAIDFCARPFNDIYHMREALIKNYNATVPEGATCYFLGDIGFGGNGEFKEKVLKRLIPSTKVLIVGNHDKGPYNMGFDAVMYGAILQFGDVRISMSHCPLVGVPREDTSTFPDKGKNWHGEYKLGSKFSLNVNGVTLHLHGHCHSDTHERILDNQFDVGVDANDYRPISLGKIYSDWCYYKRNRND